MNKMGPRTKPWGTPYKKGEGADRVPLTETLWKKPENQESNHESTEPDIPKQVCRWERRMEWWTVSKAAEISRNVRREILLLSRADSISFQIFKSAVSVLWPDRWEDWRWFRSLLIQKCSRSWAKMTSVILIEREGLRLADSYQGSQDPGKASSKGAFRLQFWRTRKVLNNRECREEECLGIDWRKKLEEDLLQRSTAAQVRSSVWLMPQNQPSGRDLLLSPTAWSPDQHHAAMLADVFRHILGRTEGRGLGFGQLVRTHKGKCLKHQSSSTGLSDHSALCTDGR